MLGYQGDAIGSHFVDDASVGEDCLAPYQDAIDHRHRDGNCCVIDHLTLDSQLIAPGLYDIASLARHPFRSDHFNAKSTFAYTLDYVENHTRVAVDQDCLNQ